MLVLAEWAWVYIRNERGARLITGNIDHIVRSQAPLPAPAAGAAVRAEP